MIYQGDEVRIRQYGERPWGDMNVYYEVDEVVKVAKGHGGQGERYLVWLVQLTENPGPREEE